MEENITSDVIKEEIAPPIKRERDHSLDFAKGILICSVVWGHLGFLSRTNVGKNISLVDYHAGIDWPDWTYQAFYMCAFFIISGIFDHTFSLKNIYKNAKSLLVPIITIFVPFTILASLLRDSSQNVLDIIKSIAIPWFVAGLFWIKCFMYVLNKLKIKGWYAIVAAIILHFIGLVLLKNNLTFLCLEYGLLFFIFYLLGKDIQYLNKVSGRIWLLLFIISTILSHMIFHNFPNLQGGFNEDYWQVPISILMGTSGSMAFIKLIKKIGRSRLFEYIGERTLMIYFLASGFQLTFIHYFADTFKLMRDYNTYGAGLFWLFLNFFLPIIGCILIHNLLNKKYLKWLIGKW